MSKQIKTLFKKHNEVTFGFSFSQLWLGPQFISIDYKSLSYFRLFNRYYQKNQQLCFVGVMQVSQVNLQGTTTQTKLKNLLKNWSCESVRSPAAWQPSSWCRHALAPLWGRWWSILNCFLSETLGTCCAPPAIGRIRERIEQEQENCVFKRWSTVRWQYILSLITFNYRGKKHVYLSRQDR